MTTKEWVSTSFSSSSPCSSESEGKWEGERKGRMKLRKSKSKKSRRWKTFIKQWIKGLRIERPGENGCKRPAKGQNTRDKGADNLIRRATVRGATQFPNNLPKGYGDTLWKFGLRRSIVASKGLHLIMNTEHIINYTTGCMILSLHYCHLDLAKLV